MQKRLKKVSIYIASLFDDNLDQGGYGIVLRFKKHTKKLRGSQRQTTRNRLNTVAMIKGLQALKEPCRVTIYSNLRVVVDALNSDKTDAQKRRDVELLSQLRDFCNKHQVTFEVGDYAQNQDGAQCQHLASQFMMPEPPSSPITSNRSNDSYFDNGDEFIPYPPNDPREATDMLEKCPHGVLRVRVCRVCNPKYDEWT